MGTPDSSTPAETKSHRKANVAQLCARHDRNASEHPVHISSPDPYSWDVPDRQVRPTEAPPRDPQFPQDPLPTGARSALVAQAYLHNTGFNVLHCNVVTDWYLWSKFYLACLVF